MATRFRGDVSLILWLAVIFVVLSVLGQAVHYGVKWLGG